jgi:hypothetical protein
MHVRHFMAVLLVASLPAGSALAAGEMSTATPHASAIVFNQKLKGDSVSVRYAFLPKNGTLSIYEVDSSGKIVGSPLGKTDLSAGDHRDVQISLKSAPREGMRLRAVIETSGNVSMSDRSTSVFKVL